MSLARVVSGGLATPSLFHPSFAIEVMGVIGDEPAMTAALWPASTTRIDEDVA
jgi:hypothetical protein